MKLVDCEHQPQQQPAENDRKLRPVFEYLDNGSYKKALQEIDKLLKKNRNQQYVRALKSLTLVRLHRRKESMEILNELHAEMPADEMILQTMSMCYREIQRNDLITTLYENALKKDSTNEKLFAHLFMSYVRMNDYKKQQITALNLYKVHQKNPYYFWAIMSIYMQAMSADDETMANKIILPLAEKMCEKFYKENRFESDSEYDLYLMVLEAQKKYSRMITIMKEREMKRKNDKKSTTSEKDGFYSTLEQKVRHGKWNLMGSSAPSKHQTGFNGSSTETLDEEPTLVKIKRLESTKYIKPPTLLQSKNVNDPPVLPPRTLKSKVNLTLNNIKEENGETLPPSPPNDFNDINNSQPPKPPVRRTKAINRTVGISAEKMIEYLEQKMNVIIEDVDNLDDCVDIIEDFRVSLKDCRFYRINLNSLNIEAHLLVSFFSFSIVCIFYSNFFFYFKF